MMDEFIWASIVFITPFLGLFVVLWVQNPEIKLKSETGKTIYFRDLVRGVR